MGWLRRQPAAPAASDEESWIVANGKYGDKPMILRFNEAAERSRASFSTRAGVAVPFVEPDDAGFPGAAELDELVQIEDALDAALAADGVAACVVTTGGMREFVFYVREEGVARTLVDAARAAASRHEIQSYAADDPDWEQYAELRP